MTTKQVICPICGGPHYKSFCWKNPRRGSYLRAKYKRAYKTGKTSRRDKVLSKQPLNRKRLIMELDKYCSLITRIGASDKYGRVECYTCGRMFFYKQTDCGHYVSRQKLSTRFDLLNLKPQCTNCNRVLRGNLEAYRNHLVRDIGEEKVKELETRPPRKISTPELKEMLDEMKIEYKKIVEKRKNSLYN